MPSSTEVLEQPAKKKFTFKLRSGQHDFVDPVTGAKRHLVPGDTVQTDEDLKAIWGRRRWEKIDEEVSKESIEELKARIRILEGLQKASAEAEPAQDDFESMSVKQLREFAAKFDPPIDLTTCNGRQEIINVIRQAVDNA